MTKFRTKFILQNGRNQSAKLIKRKRLKNYNLIKFHLNKQSQKLHCYILTNKLLPLDKNESKDASQGESFFAPSNTDLRK